VPRTSNFRPRLWFRNFAMHLDSNATGWLIL
jgi:hypothetical protein